LTTTTTRPCWFVADGSIALAELVVLDEEVRVLDVIDEEVDGRVVVVVTSEVRPKSRFRTPVVFHFCV
jgi:hypothetical protein